MRKSYNNLSDVEKFVIREYRTWTKSNCAVAYKLSMLELYMNRALNLEIDHML